MYERISTQRLNIGALLENARSHLPSFVLKALSLFNLGDIEEIQSRLTSLLMQASQALASRALTVGHGTAQFSPLILA